MITYFKNIRDRRIMQETVIAGFEESCNRIQKKCISLKNKLANGGGEAIIKIIKEAK